MIKVKSVDGVQVEDVINTEDTTQVEQEVTQQEEFVQQEETFTDNEQEENVNTEEQEVNTDLPKLVFEKDEDLIEYVRSKKLIETNDKEIPQEILGYLEYKKETNRGIEDYLKLQQDFTQVSEAELVKQYIKEQNPDYTAEEVEDEFVDTFGYDEDLADEKEIKRKTRSYKKAYSEALDYFNGLKEQYKTPVEVQQSVDAPKDYQDLVELKNSLKAQEERVADNYNFFINKTNELFSEKFEGFKFKVGEDEVVHKPSNVDAVKQSQSDLSKFIGKFLDENGKIKDAEAYHKALYMAMNYESVLANVYETAKAKAIEAEIKESKNINFSGLKSAPETFGKKTRFKVVQ